jgi:D-alanyl-D-alanine dipeptidase
MRVKRIFILAVSLFFSHRCFAQLPPDFDYLHKVDPSILQDLRYAGNHNFIGRPIAGYKAGICILTHPSAIALKKVQNDLLKQGLTLKVYDCYRPVVAVKDFIHWSTLPKENEMKTEFFPRIDKAKLFEQGYVAEFSGHSRGSTVDLTIVDLVNLDEAPYHAGQPLVNCYAPWSKRFRDNSIDMGSGYDCLDEVSHTNSKQISSRARVNRLLLKRLMIKHGFVPYDKEWWHFTLKNEPFPKTYFNFPVALE